MVSAQDSGLRGLGSRPGPLVNVLCSSAKHFILTVLFSTQEYEWVLVNCQGILIKCWRVTYNGQAPHPDGGSNLRLDGTLDSRTDFT